MSFKDIDLDIINAANFQNHMRMKLILEPNHRSQEDIDCLKKCTSYLNFFDNIMQMDPEDKYRAHSNGCKLLKYRKQPKGSILTKYKDQANEFFISLNGKIGVFIPRNSEEMKEELEAIYWIQKRIGFEITIYRKDLVKLSAEVGQKHRYSKYLKAFQKVMGTENKVRYKDEWLFKKTKGLRNEDILPESEIFNENKVFSMRSIFSS